MIRVILIFAFLVAAAPAGYAKPSVSAARIGEHPAMTRFVMELSESPSYKIFTLPDPFRVVIDLPEVDWRLADNWKPNKTGIIQDLRFGLFAPGTSRVVLDVNRPARVRAVKILPPAGSVKTYRIVIDLAAVTRTAFFAAERRPFVSAIPLPVPRSATPSVPAKPRSDKRRTVVIDAGHGGIDPGATGVSGLKEKALVLQYARELQRQLVASGRYRVFMTRNRDVFMKLSSRVALAQKAEGDIFISLHANTHPKRGVRGASVYTLSEKGASDAETKALADKENRADILAGVNLTNQTDDVSQILLDLTQRETMNLSKSLANIMVKELGRSTRLLNKTHRFAGFAVLKSLTVPSVLVEVGYMTNRSEESLLRSKAHRAKVSKAIIRAIDRYFKWQDQVSRT